MDEDVLLQVQVHRTWRRPRVGQHVVEGGGRLVERRVRAVEMTGGLTHVGRQSVDVYEGLDIRIARGGVCDNRTPVGVSDEHDRTGDCLQEVGNRRRIGAEVLDWISYGSS